MEKRLILSLVLCLFLLGTVSAMTTVVQIKTLPSHDVYVTPIRTGSSFDALVQTMHFYSDGYGDVEATFEVSTSTFDLAVKIKNGDTDVLYEKFTESYVSGSLINLTVAPEGAELFYRPVVNKSITTNFVVKEEIKEAVTTENVSENESLQKGIIDDKVGFLSGLSIMDFNKPYVKIVGYSLGGIIILVIIFIFVRKKRRKSRGKIIKYRMIEAPRRDNFIPRKDSLEDAEKELRRAQERVEILRNNDKLVEAKKKLIEAEKEILKLRGVASDDISMKDRLNKDLNRERFGRRE